ncbi:hypothetical protein NL108_017288 [Boleophthalmus pectinirostris]|nr:hypothetical protein NL108_017288 [Boleophthalmus pectinirostris]
MQKSLRFKFCRKDRETEEQKALKNQWICFVQSLRSFTRFTILVQNSEGKSEDDLKHKPVELPNAALHRKCSRASLGSTDSGSGSVCVETRDLLSVGLNLLLILRFGLQHFVQKSSSLFTLTSQTTRRLETRDDDSWFSSGLWTRRPVVEKKT